MGKGDTRTRRGKLFNRSYGKSRAQEKHLPTKRRAARKKKDSK